MMKKRKIAMISAFATAILCGALGFASCKKNEEPPAPEEPKDKVTVSAEEIRLDLHESAELFAVSALGKTIEWENSAPSVAVYENGKVSALAEGNAVLTAKTGEASASCSVTVYNSYSAPVLTADTEFIRFGEGDSFLLQVYARYKGNDLSGIEYETKVTGEAISVVEKSEGAFLLTAEKTGEAYIEITANVYGVLLYRKVRAEVIGASETVSFSKAFQPSEGGFKTSMVLSEMTGTAEMPLGLKVTKNGEDVTPDTVDWSSTNEDIARVQNGSVVAENAGVATLSATIFGNVVQLEIAVGRKTVKLSDTFIAERRNGEGEIGFELQSALLGSAEKAYFSNGENVLSALNGTTLTLNRAGMPAEAAQMGENVPFTIETNKVIYSLRVSLYTRRIATAEDLDLFISDGAGEKTSEITRYAGYYVLTDNVEYGGKTYSASIKNENTVYSFGGVFDGQGYNINDISMCYGGLVGNLADGAVIKNLSFTNAVNSAAQVAGFLAQGVKWSAGFSIENIYVHFRSFRHCNTATRTDVENNHRNYKNGGYTGVIFAGEQWNQSAKIDSGKVNKVFVCADEYVESAGEGTILGNGKAGCSGFANIYGYGIGGKISHWDSENVNDCGGVYVDKAAMQAAQNNYNAFESDDFWQIDLNGLPYPARLDQTVSSEKISENKVIKSISGAGENAIVSAFEQSFTIDVKDVETYLGGTLTSLAVGANTYTDGISYADGIITVSHAPLLTAYGMQSYSATFSTNGKNLKVTGRTLFITFEITSKDELDAMAYVTENAIDGDKTYGGYITLGADVAYNGAYGNKMEGRTFTGTFDGKGHNIDGLSMGWASMFGTLKNCAIKNLSFTNAENSAAQVAGFLAQGVAWENNDFSIENIYVHFKTFYHCTTATKTDVAENHRNYKNGGYTGVIFTGEQWNQWAKIGYGKVDKVFVCADEYVSGAGEGTILGNAASGGKGFTNIYGYGIGGKISHWDSETQTACGGVYGDKAALKAANVNYSAFTADSFWQLDSDGVPVSKSAALKSAAANA